MKQGDVTIQDEAVILPTSEIIIITRDLTLATGSTGYTGIGFRPSFLQALGGQDNSDKFSWGFSNETDGGGINDRNGAGADTYGNNGSLIFVVQSGGVGYSGDVASFDVDGFTIDWTRIGAPTGSISIKVACFK